MLVSFRDDLQLPRFPDPQPEETRRSATNRGAFRNAQRLVEEITAARAERFDELTRHIRGLKGRSHERFWIVNAMLVDMPLGAVSKLADREDVLYVEPRFSGEVPPQNANANDDVDDGRARIVTDPYFNLGQTGGWIGLLDTGVRFTHTQFNSPSHIDFRRDCVNGGADCNTGTSLNPNDDCWNHGTSSAAIITANANQGNAFRGVTGITLDSFKVYPSTTAPGGGCSGFLDSAAAVRGFQAAVGVLDRVIVAEMQGGGDDLSAISRAADAAFDAGAVVIAANGNNGPNASTVNTPANAHRVIGVGNFDVQTQNQVTSRSRGPAPPTAVSSLTSRRPRTPKPPATPRIRHSGRSPERAAQRRTRRARRHSSQLAPGLELQHRPWPGVRAADPLRSADVPVQQHQRRRPDPAPDERMGLVGEGLGRRTQRGP